MRIKLTKSLMKIFIISLLFLLIIDIEFLFRVLYEFYNFNLNIILI